MNTLGTHLLCDLTGSPREKLASVAFVESSVRAAAAAAKGTVLSGQFAALSGDTVSGVLTLAEGRASIWTQAEAGYAAIDVFAWGDTVLARAIVANLSTAIGGEQALYEITRGSKEKGRFVSIPYTREEFEGATVALQELKTPVKREPVKIVKRFKPQALDLT